MLIDFIEESLLTVRDVFKTTSESRGFHVRASLNIKLFNNLLFRKEEHHKLKSLKLKMNAVNNCFYQRDTSLFSNQCGHLFSFITDEVCLNIFSKQCRVFVRSLLC